MQVWEAVMAVALIFTLLVQPFRICFTPPGFDYPDIGWFVEWAVNIVFIADMAVNCITGIYVSVVGAFVYRLLEYNLTKQRAIHLGSHYN